MDAEARELIAGYALDALEPAERARAEDLLERSDEAREELRAFTEATAAMAIATAGPAPDRGLRDSGSFASPPLLRTEGPGCQC